MSLADVVFGFGAHTGLGEIPELLRMARQADREGLDLFSLSDHPYIGGRVDAYAALGFVLGGTERLAGLANVTNLPTRPAAMLARTVTSLSALSGGRVVLGMGAGGLWDRIADMGVPPLAPGAAVEAFEEAITLVRLLSGGGEPVTFEGRYYRVEAIEPAPVPAPPVWTGSVGPRSLRATGRVADGWIPGHAADWLSERYRTSRPLIDAAAESAGRDPRDVRTVYNLPGRITDRPLPATRDRDGRWIGGSVAQWAEELTSAVVEHGASGFILFPPGHAAHDDVSLGRWAAEIAPAVREGVRRCGVGVGG
ncbi:LLM class flavin-dependent oxidoreductase [Spirillospora albida]|uniref:LLM class flavin-dependent oxidoreductase n=1 Tax=Spirillospora albida TaxID=58123 RepID=UPI0004BF60C8|nr:LLM class flavin-dependent oxidoreductase [Spirillospora albida]